MNISGLELRCVELIKGIPALYLIAAHSLFELTTTERYAHNDEYHKSYEKVTNNYCLLPVAFFSGSLQPRYAGRSRITESRTGITKN